MKLTLHSIESPLVLYSEQDASLAAHRMRRARQARGMSAEAFEQKKRRDLGLGKPKKKSWTHKFSDGLRSLCNTGF